MKLKLSNTKRAKWFVISTLALIAIGVPDMATYQQTTEIDIGSGKLRIVRSFLGISLTSIEDTAFSKMVAQYSLSAKKPQWKQCSERTFWNRTSPHFVYHSHAQALGMLAQVLESSRLSAGREESVGRVIKSLRGDPADKASGVIILCKIEALADRASVSLG